MRYIIAVVIFTTSLFSSAQSVITRTFSSGYVTDSIYRLINEIKIKNDSIISFTNQQTLTGSDLDYVIDYSLRKSDLSIARIDTLWNTLNKIVKPFNSQGTQRIYAGYLSDSKNTNSLFDYEIYAESNTNQIFSLFSTQNEYRDDTLFQLKWSNKHLLSKPFIYDSTVYCYTINEVRDTGFFEVYNMKGNIVKNKISTINDFSNYQIPFDFYTYGPIDIHPNNDSIVFFEEKASEVSILLVNRYTLDTIRRISMSRAQSLQLVNNHLWGTVFPSEYSYENNGFSVFGILVKLPPNLVGNDYLKYGKLKFDWQGTLLNFEEYGEVDVYSRGYGYDKEGQNEYLVGSSPFVNFSFTGQEYRKVLLFKIGLNSVDSLLLYGNKNHVATDVLADLNGDVFIKSQYSNAWSDDSLFYVVTKVPNILFTSIKEYNPKITSIRVFPNPTMDLLKVDGAVNGDSYRVISISGQLMQEGVLNSDKAINVASLKQGSYILQLGSQQQTYRANVFIKQ